MKKTENKYRFLFAGGGTGGHLFPAIAVAEKIRMLRPEAEFLFLGTKSKIESVVVPKLGYNFSTIWIKGFARRFDIQNILFPLKLVVSALQSLWINIRFKPRVAIGSGGYVSGPAVWGASVMGAKVILLEQNSYPGITTRLLEKRANEVHLSFEDSKKYLKDKSKLFVTGNPVRSSLHLVEKSEALKKFNLSEGKKTLLVLGGSLGARSVNEAVSKAIPALLEKDIQVIWQTGKNYYDVYKSLEAPSVWINPFIEDMGAAFSACDLLISRAGATTIAEITMLGIPTIFVPSPNVAANHQYLNAKSLSDKQAAILQPDDKASQELAGRVLEVIFDKEKLERLSSNVKLFSKPDAALIVAQNAIKLAESL
ncbi:MAG: undecaprenyldiphospho-muramoylpentapeptide beta-N-acetylglucosaminyltransferase [Ignavibacteria bacterium]|jgi:UDP-N-acetylglucosamine--N-acetylmuramyl-(pentapeptide) pyrophosphoryl-undecaprenol N-acetylglucosamine transferase|nr:undecaprenyldiphospho-muramoylpentapeptide beta-N-acetylglucosaminyltransferase [Ignavibacteria bacterium]MCU7503153.1 undecaprenyldiphospho-muramoylpentapeptide beta-N-acetylglucosaminyltransferase [Ignavibacteria bacterium]MCU7518031.1 undecaprenyldiphospho-muramoylpentapeptide beta-N-acetylglucosaminyltransferase [Ignavibacteria bacterium]